MGGVDTISLGFQCGDPVGVISLGFVCDGVNVITPVKAPGNHVRFFDQARGEDDDILMLVTAFMEMLDE